MSKKNNSVAIWFGSFKSQNEFQEFVKVQYEMLDKTDDLQSISSKFEKIFSIKEHDRDLVEINTYDENKSYKDLVKGASYLDAYIDALPDEKSSYNSVILIYDYEFNGEPLSYVEGESTISFFDNVIYKKKVDVSKWLVE